MWRVEFDANFQTSARNYPERVNIFDINDADFIDRHRFPKDAVMNICDILRSNLERFTHRSMSLPVETQVCVAMRYYGVGGFMREIGDLYGISEKSAGRCVHSVSSSLSNVCEQFISWPSSSDIREIKERFYSLSNGFPRIVGIIDGCHIPIRAPSSPYTEVAFVNRKGWHSLNTQIVCDCDFKIIEFNALFPGSNHDSFILRQSSIYDRFQSDSVDGLLLGDSGYPLLPWLMTPILRPTSISEQSYNVSHKRTRNIVERCNGILKSRFRCLTTEITFNPKKASKIIGACACLHNYAIRIKLPNESVVLEENHFDDQFIGSQPAENSFSGRATRNQIVLANFG